MSSRSYRPPPGHDEAPRSGALSRRPSALQEGESDLFGRPATQAGGELFPRSEVTGRPGARHSTPPPAQAESRPAARRAQTSATQAPRIIDDAPPPSFSFGHRDENSVLFSVADLAKSRAQTAASAPAPAEPAYGHDAQAFGDMSTGMVDLRAIANTTQSSLAIKPLDIAHLRPAVVPVTHETNSLWPAPDKPQTPMDKFVALAKGPRAPLLFGGLAVCALLFVGFGAALTAWALSGNEPELSASLGAPPAVEPAIIEHEVVRRTKVADAAESTAPTHAPARRHSSSARTSSSSKSSSGPKPVSKKASDPCNCHGVLACAMRCTK